MKQQVHPMSAADRVLTASLADPVDGSAADYMRTVIDRSFSPKRVDIRDDHVAVVLGRERDRGPSPSRDDLQRLIDRLVSVSKNLDQDLIHEHITDRAYAEDPQPLLEERGDIRRVGPGLYAFSGAFLSVVRGIGQLMDGLARSYDAVEEDLPALVPVDALCATSYLTDFPQAVMLCATVRPDYDSRRTFAQAYRKTSRSREVALDGTMAPARFGLRSAISPCCFGAMAGAPYPVERVSVCASKVYDTAADGRSGLDRLTSYTLHSIMAAGEETFVMGARAVWLEDARRLAALLDLECRIETGSDPFFGSQAALKNVFQHASRLKYEIQAYLPFADRAIPVGAVNLHLDAFSRAFGQCGPDGTYPSAACFGIAQEPLAYALFCQYGPDLQQWPDRVRIALGLDGGAGADMIWGGQTE